VTHLTRAIGTSRRSWRPLRLALLAMACAASLRVACAALPGDDGADVARLSREVAALRHELALRRAAARGAPAEQDRQTLEAEARDRVRARALAIEVALGEEAVDARWSSNARVVIRRALADEALAATSVEDLECRATLCRLRVTHGDARARAAFEREFPGAVAALLPQLMVEPLETEGESPSSLVYMARDGRDLSPSD
jgi:hypothetical protein